MLKMYFYHIASIVLFLSLGNLRLSAQESMLAGYIIKDGDTIVGQIIPKDQSIDQLGCFFIEANGNKQEYTPETISAWGFKKGSPYRSVSLMENGTNQKRFAKVLLDGYADLLLFVDNDGVNRFLICKDSGSCQEVNDPKTPADINKAKGRLIYLLGNNDDIRKVVYKEPFTIDGMLKILENFNQLNQAGNPGKRYKDKRQCIALNFSIHAGYSLSTIQFPESKYNNLDGNYDLSTAPVFAVAADLAFGGSTEQFGLRLGLNYQTHHYKSEETMIELSSIRLPLHVVYRRLKKSNSLQLFAGMFADQALSIVQEGVYLADPQLSMVISPARLIEFPKKSIGYGMSVGIDYLFPLGKTQKLMLSASYAIVWSDMTFKYFANYKDLRYLEYSGNFKSTNNQSASTDVMYSTWVTNTINHKISYIDFKLGFLF